jgi:hypothetical protein
MVWHKEQIWNCAISGVTAKIVDFWSISTETWHLFVHCSYGYLYQYRHIINLYYSIILTIFLLTMRPAVPHNNYLLKIVVSTLNRTLMIIHSCTNTHSLINAFFYYSSHSRYCTIPNLFFVPHAFRSYRIKWLLFTFSITKHIN